MSTSEVRNPLFARFYVRIARSMEPEVGPYRDELLAGLEGRVVEVGAGNGQNFVHYPSTVREVVAVEPEPYLRAKALEAAADAPVPVTIVDAVADALPFEDASFDGGVCSLVLCTVPDPAVTLAELRRVLRPGAELRFFEHVRSDSPRKARVQNALDRSGVWPRLLGGCHCGRDTHADIAAAGFDVEQARYFRIGSRWDPSDRHLLGRARVG